MENCIFCKIVNKEIPAQITHEDEHSIAFLDIHPKAPGHTLLIPKEHYQWFEELPDSISDPLFRNAKQIAKKLKKEYGANLVRISVVGDEVPHTHIHLIPQNL